MCDRQLNVLTSHKIFGHLLVSALVGYFGWRVVEKIFGKKNKSNQETMFNWLTTTHPKLLKDPEQTYSVKLIEKENITHDTRRFRFEIPEKHVLGLPTGKHISVLAQIGENQVIRSYTPVSSDDDVGYFELVIKIYFKNVHPKFPDGGKLTQYLESLKIGDSCHIRGPKGRLEYFGNGEFSISKDPKTKGEKKRFKKVSMVAGGTGIAPMLQIIRQVFNKSTADKTEIALLFANQTEDDILLRDELEQEAKNHPNQFKFWYTLDRPKDGWKYSQGFVNKEMIQKYLHPVDKDTIMLMCGPPPMMSFVNGQLDELEWPVENRFKY